MYTLIDLTETYKLLHKVAPKSERVDKAKEKLLQHILWTVEDMRMFNVTPATPGLREVVEEIAKDLPKSGTKV